MPEHDLVILSFFGCFTTYRHQSSGLAPSSQSEYHLRKSLLGFVCCIPSPQIIHMFPRSGPETITCQSIPQPSVPTKMLP